MYDYIAIVRLWEVVAVAGAYYHIKLSLLTYHIKQLNPWLNSSASRVVNYSWLSTCQSDIQPFKGDLSTCGRLTSLRNKPQRNKPKQLSASIPA